MKKILPLLILLAAVSVKAFAYHFNGGEISYQQINSNTFQVTFKEYRDCAAFKSPADLSVNVKSPGCNTGRNITLTKVAQYPGRPYGPSIPVSCVVGSPVNYEVSVFTGQLTFTAAERACSDWVLSWTDCCKNNMENIVNGSNFNLYVEAKLKLGAGLINSSPAFDTLTAPVMFVNVGQLYNLNMGAIDPDGDSLVYSLVAPLTAANTAVSYSANTNFLTSGLIFNANPKPPYNNPMTPQVAQLQSTIPSVYSPVFPMVSVFVNWSGLPTVPYPGAPGNMIWAATPGFQFNAANGNLKFQPYVFHPNTASILGRNHYMVAILVEEYRKINGVITKLGSIQRETMIQVFDNPTHNPEFGAVIANNQPIANGTEIRLRPGTPLNLQFSATEPDPTEVLQASTNAGYILPGSTFAASTGNSISGTITWTPTAAQVRWQPYYFQILVRDNASSLRGVHVETIAVRVIATGGVTGTKDELATENFTAYPNPFSSELNFRLNLKTKAESIVIYNLLGQQVDRIPLATIGVGEQKLQWQNAGKYAAGTYVAKLVLGDKAVQTIKFTKLL